MRIRRPGYAIGMVLVAAVIMTGVFRSGGSFATGIPASNGSVQLVLLFVAVLGIAVLSMKFFTDNSPQSPFDTTGSADTEEALETLKRRFAAGELDEIEFERKLEMLFETETVDDAERRVETQSISAEQRPQEESESRDEERSPQRFERPPKRVRPRSRRGHCK